MSDRQIDILKNNGSLVDNNSPPSVPAPHKKPGRRSKSGKDMESRVEFTSLLLGQMLPRSQILKILRGKYQVSLRSCETYLSRARERLVQWTQQTREELHFEAVCYYRSIIQNPSVDLRDKLLARKRLDELFGLEPPTEHKIQGNTTQSVEVTIEDILASRERVLKWRQERFPGYVPYGRSDTPTAGKLPE